MKYITAFVVGLGMALIVVAALMFARSAHAAEWPASEWRKAPKVERKYTRPKRTNRKRRAPRVKAWVKKYNGFKEPTSTGCKPTIKVVGDQAATDKGARAQADKAWSQQARYEVGEQHADLEFARDRLYRCVHSSIPNLATRAADAVGIDGRLKRCLLIATPCIAPVTK